MKQNSCFKVSRAFIKMCVGFFLLIIPVIAFTKNKFVKNGTDPQKEIHEEKFILVNDIEQWVTIHGDRNKPVILFLHGGPGSPISPYSANLYKSWEKDFIIVQWDQRGTGKTFGRTAPEELTPEYLKANPLTVEQMVADGTKLSEHLLKYLNKKKIILFGTSWGSALGVKIVTTRPELFYAYIGHSQITNPDDDLTLYNKVYRLAEKNKDTTSLDILNTAGLPPYTAAKNIGKLFRVVKKYEGLTSTPAPDSWFILSTAYDNTKDNQHRSDGDDYSFVNYVGDEKLGVTAIRATINLAKDNVEFKIPVYFIQGAEDLLTPEEATKKYFESIKAPVKKYFLLPKTAHGFNSAVLDTQYNICKAVKTD